MHRTSQARFHFPLIMAALLASSSSFALADATWTLDANGQWSTPANWSTNPIFPNGQDVNVLFGNATTAARTITLSNGTYTVGNITFDSAFGYTLATSLANLTLSTSTGNASITVNHTNGNSADTISASLVLAAPTVITNNDLPGSSQNNLTLSGAISGNQSLTFNGPGQVVLSGNNSNFTGPISINNGTLFASSSTALGSATSAADGTTINTGGILAINTAAAVANEFITLNGSTLTSNTSSTVTLNNFGLSDPNLFAASDSSSPTPSPEPCSLAFITASLPLLLRNRAKNNRNLSAPWIPVFHN